MQYKVTSPKMMAVQVSARSHLTILLFCLPPGQLSNELITNAFCSWYLRDRKLKIEQFGIYMLIMQLSPAAVGEFPPSYIPKTCKCLYTANYRSYLHRKCDIQYAVSPAALGEFPPTANCHTNKYANANNLCVQHSKCHI